MINAEKEAKYMEFDYEYGYQTLPNAMEDEMFMTVLMVMLGVFAVILVFWLVLAVLRALSLYTIARRRGIRKAWLSWIPIGNMWILGSLSDQYQHLALGQIKSRRKILMVLQLLGVAVGIAAFALGIVQAMAEANGEQSNVMALAGMLPNLAASAVSIATLVFYHISNYDLYRSCDPKNAVVYLVVGIIIPVVEPFFYLAVRKRDDGMPKPEPVEPIL